MKKFVINMTLIVCCFLSFNAFSGKCKNCVIDTYGTGVYYGDKCVNTDHCVVFSVTGGTVLEKPDCAKNSTWDYVIDASTDTGKSMLSQIAIAYTTGAVVNVHGAGECTMYPSGKIEDTLYMFFSK